MSSSTCVLSYFLCEEGARRLYCTSLNQTRRATRGFAAAREQERKHPWQSKGTKGMAISTADFKNGMCIEYNGKLCTIVEFQHVKPGKGGAFVRTKLKDIKTGRVVDYTFNAGTKFDSVRLESKKMQYLYNDGADYWFMDNSTFEQMPVSADMVGSAADWLKENDEATLLYAGDELISLEPQMFVELEVTHTEPGFKGDTATNTLKPATLETGKEVQVPTFIEIGDVLQIDTRDGRVIKRV